MAQVVETLTNLASDPKNLAVLQNLFSKGKNALPDALNALGTTVGGDIASTITDNAGNKLQEAGSAFAEPMVYNPDLQGSIDTLITIRTAVTIVSVIWILMLLAKKYTTYLSEQTKEDIDYINSIAFGSGGVLGIVIYAWILIVAFLSLITLISSLDDLISKFNKFFAILTGATSPAISAISDAIPSAL